MSEAIESAQPKAATVEERFPVGSRWRRNRYDRSSEGLGRVVAIVGVAPQSECPIRDSDGNWWSEDFFGPRFERLDDHPTPPPVAEPAAPVPMVGDVWLCRGREVELRRIYDDHSISGGLPGDGISEGPRYAWMHAEHLHRECSFVRRAQPQPAAPAKPAPMCEFPDRNGNRHAYERSAFGCCVTCGAGDSDRRAVRRRAFDAAVYTEKGPAGWKRGHEIVWRAAVSGIGEAFAPVREDAIEALFAKIEAERGG